MLLFARDMGCLKQSGKDILVNVCPICCSKQLFQNQCKSVSMPDSGLNNMFLKLFC